MACIYILARALAATPPRCSGPIVSIHSYANIFCSIQTFISFSYVPTTWKSMMYLSNISRWLMLLPMVVGGSYAKFEEVFPGLSAERLLVCTANLTRAEYTARSACESTFACILDNTNNYDQAIFSSGSAVLGFVSVTKDMVRRVYALRNIC